MLVTTTTEPIGCGSPASRTPSILDSPTLARVERARLRLEASSNQQLHQLHQQHHQQQQQHQNQLNHNTLRDGSLERTVHDSKKEVPWHQVWTHMKRLSNNSKVNSTNTLTTAAKTHCSTPMKKFSMIPDSKTTSLSGSLFRQQVFYQPEMHSLLAGRIPVASMTGPIKRGLLWQQRDRLFSRWKERYFILTRDYLHCFKRASGSANERASDMGQFIFKVKLVDVEKVEWLNRRSYSAIGLLLGREGRVLLRCDDGLEDWFELLEECTLTSKERRRALKITQGPRSRASLAAPVSHASLQAHHFGLGGTYSSALDDWLMTNRGGGCGGAGGAGGTAIGRHHKIIGSGSICGGIGINPFLFSDSVPDLSALNNENHNHHLSGISTNHSTPQKIPYSSAAGGHHHAFNLNRYSNGHLMAQNSSCGGGGGSAGLYGSPRRIFINSFGSNNIVDEEATEEAEVQMRRPRANVFRNNNLNNNNNSSAENGNNNESDRDWLYRKPRPPTDARHSMQPTTDLDYSLNNDSGLDTPPSTHRPSSYRDASHASPRDSTETTVSSSRGTLLNHSPGGSFRAKHSNYVATNLNQVNSAINGSRYSVQERILKMRNDDDRCSSIKSANRMSQQHQHHNHNHNTSTLNEHASLYDPNQNRYCCKHSPTPTPATTTATATLTAQRSPNATGGSSLSNGNGNAGALNGNFFPATNLNGSAIFRERYQHPALAAIISESQGLKFRDRSYSDCQKGPQRRTINNNPSPTSRRLPIFGTPTRT